MAFSLTSRVKTSIATGFSVFVVLILIVYMVPKPVLLAQRFFEPLGLVEVFLLAIYGSLVCYLLADERMQAKWRRRIWLVFSCWFFLQLLLGLIGLQEFLMTGVLHLPVPAMILGGPLYRGGGLFMPILFVSTVVLAGPAWCSYLCYLGAWDLYLARLKRKPERMPRFRLALQVASVFAVGLVALLLRFFGAPSLLATMCGACFGLVGVGIMILWSRKLGQMVHCTAYCPIGLLATILGKLSFWRLKISDSCSDCGACTFACRYDALRPEDIKNRRVGLSCTLCGDCIRTCKARSIEYSWLWFNGYNARLAFVAVISTLHAVFFGVARI